VVRSLARCRTRGTCATKGALVALLTLVSGSIFAQPQELQEAAEAQARPGAGLAPQVDCLLPSQIRRYGQEQNQLAPRRLVRASSAECAQRNGEVVVVEGR
jgi:hypothetical protein